MKKYINIKSDLETCECKFIDDGVAKSVRLEIDDIVSIEKIKNEKAYLSVARSIKFTPLAEAYANVVFDAVLEAKEAIIKKELEKDLKAGLPLFGNVYSRISLLIAELTKDCMFGTVITPPMYDGEQLKIIDNSK